MNNHRKKTDLLDTMKNYANIKLFVMYKRKSVFSKRRLIFATLFKRSNYLGGN